MKSSLSVGARRPLRWLIHSIVIGFVVAPMSISTPFSQSGNSNQGLGLATLRVIETDADNDGSIDRVQTSTRAYDQRGNLVEFVSETDADNDGSIDFVRTTTFAYDQRGNRVEQVLETDADNDGSIDRVLTITSAYDQRGNLVESVSETDADNDGTVDSVSRSSVFY